MDNKNDIMLEQSAKILRLDPQNAVFSIKNGFLSLSMNNGDNVHQRVFLHRAFPYDHPYEYISVLDDENKEIGIIYDIQDFKDSQLEIIKNEIDRKYYCPVIVEIKNVKERYGFSYWKVLLKDEREIEFTMRDTYKNIIHISSDSIMISDVDGNRYRIESVSSLGPRSYRKIELYL